MKRIFTSLIVALLATASVFATGEKVLVLFADSTDTSASGLAKWSSDSTIIAKLKEAGFDVTPKHIADAASVTYADYAVAICTETPGSGDISNSPVGSSLYTAIPTINLKGYSFKKNDWTWVADFKGLKNDDYADIATSTEIEIAAGHEILGGKYDAGQTLSFASSYYEFEGTDPHIQTFNFENSTAADIKAAATIIATSTWAANGPDAASYEGIEGMIAVVDENASSKRSVLFGVHALYLGVHATEDFWWLFLNSVRWAAGLDVEVVSAGSVVADKVSVISAGGSITASADAVIYDILGSTVASIAVGESAELPTGVYVVVAAGVSTKVVVE